MKRGQRSHLFQANFIKRGLETHQKEAQSQTPPATSMTTTTLAMSSPQAAAAPQQTESSESIPSQGSSLSPEWIHAITNLMGHPLTSEIGQRIQKWVLNQAILDYTDL